MGAKESNTASSLKVSEIIHF